jgi:plastocyanin
LPETINMKKAIERRVTNEQALMLILAIILCATALWAIGCGGGGGSYSGGTSPSPAPAPAPAPSPTPSVTVNIVSSSGNGAFSPNPVQAASGSTVMWRNNTSANHVLVMDDGRSIGSVAPGASVTMTVGAGGGNYHCTTHPSMVGSINGATAPQPPPGYDY